MTKTRKFLIFAGVLSALYFLIALVTLQNASKIVNAAPVQTQNLPVENEVEWTPPPRDIREPGFWDKGL